jgi:hypothetical protein
MIRVIIKNFPLAVLALVLKQRKTSARRPSDEEAVTSYHTSNGVPFVQMRSVGLHSMSGREKEGKSIGHGEFY